MLATLIALIVSTLCVAAAVRRRRRLELVAPRDETELLGELGAAPSRAHAVAELNERLSDAHGELEGGAAVPRAAARIALAAGTLLGIIELVRGRPGGEVSAVWAGAAFGCGLLGALVTAQIGRLADSRAAELRDEWNSRSRRLMWRLPPK